MPEIARNGLATDTFFFVLGGARMLPLDQAAGIHHALDRRSSFAEIFASEAAQQIYFREPVDDFWLWRAIRKSIHRPS